MATIRLIPSTYAVSNASYLSVANASNMYNNTDNTSSYATVTNSRQSTTSYYLYIRGFNFNSIPAGAEITSFTVKLRGYEKGALFYVLVGARMPSLLFEIGYITNKTEKDLLQKDVYLESIAKSLLDSIAASKVK